MTTVDLTLEIIQQLRGLADSFELMLKVTDKQNEANGKSRKDAEDSKAECAAEENPVDAQSDINTTKQSGNTTQSDGSNAKEPEKQPTLEEVRAYLAEKNRDGHKEAIKAILARYSADKLTNLDPAHYSKVLKEAGELV